MGVFWRPSDLVPPAAIGDHFRSLNGILWSQLQREARNA